MKSNSLWLVLIVGTGGFIGSVLRYAASGIVHRIAPFAGFPYGTLVVNVVGCLLIGYFAGLSELRQGMSADLRLFLFIGLLGGFTTFSSFGYETFALWRDGEHLRGAVLVLLHVIVGLSAVWLGYVLSKVR